MRVSTTPPPINLNEKYASLMGQRITGSARPGGDAFNAELQCREWYDMRLALTIVKVACSHYGKTAQLLCIIAMYTRVPKWSIRKKKTSLVFAQFTRRLQSCKPACCTG